MFRDSLNMGTTERAIEYAVYVLSKHGKTFDYRAIAEFCACSERTIERSMPKLIKAKSIIRIGSRRNGFHYSLGESALIYAKL